MNDNTQSTEQATGNHPLNNTETVNVHGQELESFIREYGDTGYLKVIAEFEGNVTQARLHIEQKFVIGCTSLEEFMEYYLFDWESGALAEENHPLLKNHVDFRGLAVARWKAGYVRVVAHEGTFLFFDCRDEEHGDSFC